LDCAQPIHGSLGGKWELREKDGKGWGGYGEAGRDAGPNKVPR